MQKQLAECKSEQEKILESEGALDSSVQHSDKSLDESTREQAELVDSRKGLSAIDEEDRKKKLKNNCAKLDAVEEKIECLSQQSGAGRMFSISTSSMHYASQSACAIALTKEGNIYIDWICSLKSGDGFLARLNVRSLAERNWLPQTD